MFKEDLCEDEESDD